MNKRALLFAALLSTLLFTGVAGTQLVHLGKANPIMHMYHNLGDVAPDKNTEPPTISIFSPENDTVYGVDVVSLSLNASIGHSSTASSCVLDEIYCETDWQSENISIYTYSWKPAPLVVYSSSHKITEFSGTINITGIPDGTHTITVYAVESGDYVLKVINGAGGDTRNFDHYYNSFNITGSSLVRFSVDTTPPMVSILSLENKTYYSTEIQLDLALSEKPSLVGYSLDGQENVTFTGNTTLTSLAYGEHSFTVYAADNAGNVGASETIYFSIEEPFPTTLVIASLITTSFVGLGLLFYFKKRKR